jgi:hypothetical protein
MKPVRTADLTNAVPVDDGRGRRTPLTLLHLSVRDLFLRAAAEIPALECQIVQRRNGCTRSSLATGNAHGVGIASRRRVHQDLPGASISRGAIQQEPPMWPLGMALFNHPAALVPEFAAALVVGIACGYAIRARISAHRRWRAWRGYWLLLIRDGSSAPRCPQPHIAK